MADTFLLHIGADDWAVGYDPQQWVLGKARKNPRGPGWKIRGRSYHRHASTLRREIASARIELSDDGWAFLRTLPEHYGDWRRYTLPTWSQLHHA